jgi:hypothetical protein
MFTFHKILIHSLKFIVKFSAYVFIVYPLGGHVKNYTYEFINNIVHNGCYLKIYLNLFKFT